MFFFDKEPSAMGAKDIDELEKGACKFWTDEIVQKAREMNPIRLLVETQDKFLSILKCADSNPTSWVDVLAHSSLGGNQFLKHLTVLTDVGGERLQRFGKNRKTLFPSGSLNFKWKGQKYAYKFQTPGSKWDNPSLHIDKDYLFKPTSLDPRMMDVCMFLIWGSSVVASEDLPSEIREKCVIGQMLGKPDELETFVRQRYIHVSRITGGSTSNDSGNICEDICIEKLKAALTKEYVVEGHHIPDVSQNDKDLVTFDIVVRNTKTNKCCAIEISFQVTTNSVIERKALLSKDRQEILHQKGHKVAYIIDGAGNFQRRNAVSGIMRFSDCTVNFSNKGISSLANYIMKNV